MTLSEFRLWLEGYMENIEGAPNVQQWRRITSRLAEIEPSVVYKMPEFQPFDDKFKYPDFKYKRNSLSPTNTTAKSTA